ncbi:MAG: prolipoprotein diacylglyceryl transferase [Candidatus Tantalella remota]|nr:prolipoprotein diacylglyceryl transferase [Candidatus Tantalella remota]
MHRIILQMGPITLYSYGLFVAIAFFVCTMMILRGARGVGLAREKVFDCMIAMLAGGLAGGRLLFVAINWEQFSAAPVRIFMLHEGGLAFQGAFVGGALAVILVARIRRLPIWPLADLIAPYITLGQALGRIGCFLNGCCYGRVTTCGVGVVFPTETVMRIPTQVYSTLALTFIFTVLLIAREKKKFQGQVFCLYLMLYSVFRFIMDIFRGDELVGYAGLTLSQWISAGMLVVGIVLYWVLSKRK